MVDRLQQPECRSETRFLICRFLSQECRRSNDPSRSRRRRFHCRRRRRLTQRRKFFFYWNNFLMGKNLICCCCCCCCYCFNDWLLGFWCCINGCVVLGVLVASLKNFESEFNISFSYLKLRDLILLTVYQKGPSNKAKVRKVKLSLYSSIHWILLRKCLERVDF